MIKKFLSIMLVLFTLTGITQVNAETLTAPAQRQISKASPDSKVNKDEAKDIAVKFLKNFCELDFTDKKIEVRIEYRENSGIYGMFPMINNNLWDLGFQYTEGSKTRFVSVQVDSDTGRVVGFNKNDYNYPGEMPANVSLITEEQAADVARAFIEKAFPGTLDQTIIDNNNLNKYIYYNSNSPQYNFNYVRLVNGVRFDGNGINISVNGITGKVSIFTYRWHDNIEFPTADTNIDLSKAEELFRSEADMKLSYVEYGDFSNRNSNQSSKLNLIYSADYKNGNLLDAKTGNFLKPQNSYNKAKTKDLTPAEKEAFVSKWKENKVLPQELDEKQASDRASEFIKNFIGEGYDINSLRYDDGSNNSYMTGWKSSWQAQFENKKSIENYFQPSGSIVIDAVTGKLVSLYTYAFDMPSTEKFTPKLSWEEAYYKAVNLVAELYPERVRDIITEQNYTKQESYYNGVKMPERIYYFNFKRMVNGLPYENNNINIGIDIKTGEISQLNCNWNDSKKFPDLSGALNKEDAKQAFFKAFSPELIYQPIIVGNDSDKDIYEIKLVYRLKPDISYTPVAIDAFTGKSINFTNDADKIIKAFKEVIKGHWGEKEFELLALQGIVDMEDFKPSEEITRLDAIKMLVTAKGFYYSNKYSLDLKFTNIVNKDSNYKYLQAAVEYGLINNTESEFKGDEKITREEMAELMIRLLKYDRLAKAKKIFSLTYSDTENISPEKYGYVAVGTGLELFAGDNGRFRPKDNTTMAEFVVTVYKVLNLMKEVSK